MYSIEIGDRLKFPLPKSIKFWTPDFCKHWNSSFTQLHKLSVCYFWSKVKRKICDKVILLLKTIVTLWHSFLDTFQFAFLPWNSWHFVSKQTRSDTSDNMLLALKRSPSLNMRGRLRSMHGIPAVEWNRAMCSRINKAN